MSARCSWKSDPEVGRYYLPECMGGAVYGPHGCTCDRRVRIESIEDRLDRLQASVDALTRKATS